MAELLEKHKNSSMFILDDDRFFLELMKEKLKNKMPWVNLKVFQDRTNLIEHLHENPDLILLDYNLGMEDAKPLNAHSVLVSITNMNPNQKVMFISDEKTADLLDEYEKFRNVHYLLKSQNSSEQLLNAIYQHL